MFPVERPISKHQPSFSVPGWLKQKAIRRLAEVVRLTQDKLQRSISMPSISFDLSGTTAGKAYWRLNHIQLNGVLLAENQQDFMQDTIPHEFAHLVTRRLYPRASSHGKEWSYIMREVLGVSPSRCHSLDVTRAARKSRPYLYACGCPGVMHPLQESKHIRIQRWGERVLCTKCRTLLHFVKKQSTTPEHLKPTPAQVAYVTLLAEKLSRSVPAQTLENKYECKRTIEAYKAELAGREQAPAVSANANEPSYKPAAPDVAQEPASEKQRSFAEKLSRESHVPAPEQLYASKKATSQWIDEQLKLLKAKSAQA